MNIFTLLTPITYWLLVALWLGVIIFYFRRLSSKRIISPLTRLLLTILAIDAFRTLFESCYFGAWYTSAAGFLPREIHDNLVRPELVIIPKLINVFAVVLVIFILLRRWLPQEEQEKVQLNALIQEQLSELTDINNTLQTELSERQRAEEALSRLNRELRAISNCHQALMQAEDEQSLLNEICRTIYEEAGYRLAWVGYTENDEARSVRPVAWGGVDDGYLKEAKITWADTERGRGPAGTSIRSGKSSCIQDFATDLHAAPWRENALQRGFRSAISLPLKTENGETFGVFVIYSTEPGTFTPDEIRLLEKLAGDLAFGIRSLRNRSELKRSAGVAQARLRMLETAYATDISLDDTLRRMLDEIEAQTGSRIGFYHFLGADQQVLSLQSWSTNTLATMCTAMGKGFHYEVEKAGVWADCVRERRPLIHNDYVSLPNRRGMPEGHAPVVRELVVPIMRGPRIAAIVGVGNKPVEYNEADVQVVSLLADFSWEIVTRRKAEEETLLLNRELEQRVNERTVELESKSVELQNSQSALMNIVEDLNEKTAELEQANSKLKEVDQLKSMFIASMSHELRTPLNSIIGFSSITLNEWTGPLNGEQKENIAAIHRSGKHLLSLINDVIDVSKIETGKIESFVEEFDVREVVMEAVETIKKDIETKGLELKVRACRHVLHTDRRRLLQCLLNLLSNATKFTMEGTIGIYTELSVDGSMMNISVEDTGIGINEEDIGKLFSPFFRLHASGESNNPGTGLGLYLTQKLLKEILNGDVLVTSTHGVGSRFTMRVPASLPLQWAVLGNQ